jgi:protein-tyrosine-phosphatase
VKTSSVKKNILFVCIENSNRSQMAEAFAKIYGNKTVNAFSAGSRPSGKINPKAIEAMKMLGYDMTKHASKSADEFRNVELDYVITMGCGDECPFLPAKHREDWDIPDPREMPMNEFITVRNLIESKVKELIRKIEIENEARQKVG